MLPPQGKVRNTAANRLDAVVRKSDAEFWVKSALAMQQMARTPTEKRRAAYFLGRARRALRMALQRLARKQPNMSPDPNAANAPKTARAAALRQEAALAATAKDTE